jgi:Domain of unknown function (DUF4468) with TBP-like fold
MYNKLLKLTALSLFLAAIAPVPSFAQSSTEQTVDKKIKVGSKVLTQTGNSQYCYSNDGTYNYEGVMEVPNTTKKEIYSRVKQWIPQNLKTSGTDIFFDDEHNDRITFLTALLLKDVITNQSVEFKVSISFKDNKFKLEAHSFIFRGIETGTIWRKEFHNLRPLSKRKMQLIYDDFDFKFVAMIKSICAAAMNSAPAADNW